MKVQNENTKRIGRIKYLRIKRKHMKVKNGLAECSEKQII